MTDEDPSRLRWVVSASMAVAIIMIAQQIAGKAIRDAFFLANFDPSLLPRVMTAASILSVAAVLGVTRLYRWLAPAALVPAFFTFSAGLFVLEWALSLTAPKVAAVVLYMHTTSFGAVAISGFWGVMNERFDPHTAKRVIGRIAGGATLGGLMGGVAVWQGAARVSIPTMLVMLAGLNAVCAIAIWHVGGPRQVASRELQEPDSVLGVFEETPYLRHLALLVGITAIGTAGFDYVFKASAAAAYEDKEQLVSFFALFYLGVGIATFVVQTLFTGRLLKTAGLTTAINTLPLSVLVLGGAALLFPGLFWAVALRGCAATVESSFYRSGYELLYTPQPPQKKRPTKTLIDVGGDKLGGALGGAVAVFIVGLFSETAFATLLAIAVGCAALGLVIARLLARGYMTALADSLASGQLAPEDVVLIDRATRSQVLQTLARIDPVVSGPNVAAREITQAEVSSGRGQTNPQLLPGAKSRGVRPMLPNPERDPTWRAIASFRTADPHQVARVLAAARPIPPEWLRFVIPLLAEPECTPVAQIHLQRAAPANIGTLTDALLSRRVPLPARRRLADILGTVATQRSADGLLAALETEPFEIRFRATCALSSTVQKNPDLFIPSEPVFNAAEHAIEQLQLVWAGSATDQRGRLSKSGAQAGQTVAYCIRLLSCVLPAGPLDLALDAIGSDDRARRGTGLEYLDNALPPRLKAGLVPFLEDLSVTRYARRADEEILSEIERGEHRSIRTLSDLRSRLRQARPQSTGS